MFTTDCHFKNTLNLKKNKYYFSHNQKMVKDVFGKQEILLNSKLNSNITFLRFCIILVIRKLTKTQKLLILKQTYQNKQTKKKLHIYLNYKKYNKRPKNIFYLTTKTTIFQLRF